ncbi:hypothetical protein E2562_006416 [Oryza meyeriana var. granulata]|uniref:Uncharacterized protein n=1 Tax=Oryza meyeriana var. granulata TaxID=110450 RepID=A0A6G1EGI6_9ORYZ|nr:hypothetical protein E2562_006416 [Oryza meyeriana var. granulata]
MVGEKGASVRSKTKELQMASATAWTPGGPSCKALEAIIGKWKGVWGCRGHCHYPISALHFATDDEDVPATLERRRLLKRSRLPLGRVLGRWRHPPGTVWSAGCHRPPATRGLGQHRQLLGDADSGGCYCAAVSSSGGEGGLQWLLTTGKLHGGRRGA